MDEGRKDRVRIYEEQRVQSGAGRGKGQKTDDGADFIIQPFCKRHYGGK